MYYWYKVIEYEPSPPRNGRSLCKYIEEESAEAGMQASIDYIFHSLYIVFFQHWALAQSVPEVQERTISICYEDVMDPLNVKVTFDKAINFWYNGTIGPGRKLWKEGRMAGSQSIAQEHKSSTDAGLKEQLRHDRRN